MHSVRLTARTAAGVLLCLLGGGAAFAQTGPVTRISYPAHNGIYIDVNSITGICQPVGGTGVSAVYVCLGRLQGETYSYWSWSSRAWQADYTDTAAGGTANWALTSGLPEDWIPFDVDGTRYFAGAVGIDEAGASGAFTYNWFQIDVNDTTAPVCTITQPVEGPQYPGPVAFRGTASDSDTGVALVECLLARRVAGLWLYWNWNGSWGASAVAHAAVGTTDWELTAGLPTWLAGEYYVGARATDGAGNVGYATSVGFIIDESTLPLCAITEPVTGTQFPAPTQIAGTASDEVSGVSMVECILSRFTGSGYEYWNWAGAWGSTVVWQVATGTNLWSVPLPALPRGSYGVGARATDGAGNLGYAASVGFVVDESTVPVCAITQPVTGTQFPAPAEVRGTASDDVSGVSTVECMLGRFTDSGYVYWDWAGAWGSTMVWHVAGGTTAWSAALPALAPGTYGVAARATDACGNVGTAPSVVFTVNETVKPVCTITQPVEGAQYPGPEAIAGTASDAGSGVSYVECLLGRPTGGPVEYWDWSGSWTTTAVWHRAEGTTSWSTPAPTLAPGPYFAVARAVDVCGNIGNAVSVNFQVNESTRPTCTITEPVTGTCYPGPAAIRGTAADSGSGVTAVDCVLGRYAVSGYLYWDWAGAWGTVPVLKRAQGTTSWSITGNLPATWPEGTYGLSARVTDLCGNTGSADVSFTVDDNTLPTVTVTYPVDGGRYWPGLTRIEGTAADTGSGVAAVYAALGRYSTSLGRYEYWNWSGGWISDPLPEAFKLATGTEQWSVTEGFPTGWTAGNYLVLTSAVDAVGNRRNSQIPVYFHIGDGAAPTATITCPADGGVYYPTLPSFSGTAADADSGLASVRGRLSRDTTAGPQYWNWTTRTWQLASTEEVWKAAEGAEQWEVTGLPALPLKTPLTASVLVYDNAGYNCLVSNSFEIDESTPPTGAFIQPVDGGVYPSLTALTGTAADADSGVAYVECSLVKTEAAGSKYWNWITKAWDAAASGYTRKRAVGTTAWTVSPALPTVWSAAAQYTAIARVTDLCANTAEVSVAFTMQDTTPPVITRLTAIPSQFSETNRMMSVAISIGMTDDFSTAPVAQITDVTCNEAVAGPEAGKKAEWRIVSRTMVQLKAACTSNDVPRVYTLHVTCTDGAGNVTNSTVTVTITPKH